MPKIPQKVRRCTTHHYACDCREWRCEKMESALEGILALAEHEDGWGLVPVDVARLCREALAEPGEE